MSGFFRGFALWACVFVGVVAAEIEVYATSPWTDEHGYTPVVVTVISAAACVLTLATKVDTCAAQDVWQVPAGTVTRTLLLPPLKNGVFGNTYLNWSTDHGQHAQTPINQQGAMRLVMVDPKGECPRSELEKVFNGGGGISSSFRSSSRPEYCDPSALPERWQGYPANLTLWLLPAGERALSEDQRTALRAWTRTGGQLLVSDSDTARGWRSTGGQIEVMPLGMPIGELEKALQSTFDRQNSEPPSALVPGTEHAPAGIFMTLAVVFALVVGPLNLWFALKRGRHLLLLTTPAISAVFCVALVSANLIAEGISVKRVVTQLFVLDSREHRATAFTGVTFFAPFGINRFDLNADTKLTLLPADVDRSRGYTSYSRGYRGRVEADGLDGNLHLDWRGGQRADGAWVGARVNQRLLFVYDGADRRRLLLRRAGDSYELVNGLDVTINALDWCGPDGVSVGWSTVPAGASAQALRSALPEGTAPSALGAGANLAWPAKLKPGQFRAWLAAPLLPIPGPAAHDVTAIQAYATGTLTLDGDGHEALTGSAP